MKNKYYYILPILLLLATSCIKNGPDPIVDSNMYNYPLGSFSGKFWLVHKNSTTLKYDTASTNLWLVLSTTTGYAITGDTTKLHAGSYGSFIENNINIRFSDATYSSKAASKKVHLSGDYVYTYNGTKLMINGASGDTLAYTYDLTKIQ